MKPFNDTFLRACRRETVSHIPVWYMRQAGRYDADYRKIREKYSLVEIVEHPEVCVEVTKMPIEKLGVDAAILFSDIMIPIGALGLPFEIRENVGPVIDTPIRTEEDVLRLELFEAKDALPHVLQTIGQLKTELTVPLIGFTGAPFTLASYMIEGAPSREYVKTKQMMFGNTPLWFLLMDKLGDMIIHYATRQVEAGASAIQIFDSWVGSLAPDDFEVYVMPTMKRIFSALRPLNVPLIYFGVTTGELLTQFKACGATVVGIDWRVPLRSARERLGADVALQGNLDPIMLLTPWSELERRTQQILDEGMKHPGFIFNLGHGVKPSIPVEILQRLTHFIQEYTASKLPQ
jgi:uroporphyrinogen decarboxylase